MYQFHKLLYRKLLGAKIQEGSKGGRGAIGSKIAAQLCHNWFYGVADGFATLVKTGFYHLFEEDFITAQ